MAKFGWLPDLPDHRDHRFALAEVVPEVPTSVDLSPLMPPVWDQMDLGSCTSHAVAAAHQYQQLVEKHEWPIRPSRLFLYYNARLIEGTTRYDSGATIRDAVKAVARYGTCDEYKWPYDVSRYRLRPIKSAYTVGLKHQAIIYQRLNRTMVSMQGCLAESRPFIIGFSVYESFCSDDVAATGVVPMPLRGEQLLGGHAVLCVGYDDEESMFICRNSWGADWGSEGYFRLPYAYLLDENLSDDFWTIMLVE